MKPPLVHALATLADRLAEFQHPLPDGAEPLAKRLPTEPQKARQFLLRAQSLFIEPFQQPITSASKSQHIVARQARHAAPRKPGGADRQRVIVLLKKLANGVKARGARSVSEGPSLAHASGSATCAARLPEQIRRQGAHLCCCRIVHS